MDYCKANDYFTNADYACDSHSSSHTIDMKDKMIPVCFLANKMDIEEAMHSAKVLVCVCVCVCVCV